MQKMFLSLLAAGSLSALAGNSNVIVTPGIPVDCAVEDNGSVNWIHSVEKISENANQVSFSLTTNYGSCFNNQIKTREVTLQRYTLEMFHIGANFPFEKRYVTSSLEHVGAGDDVRVVLTFDKAKCFKKKGKQLFLMTFRPNNGDVYNWRIQLVKSSDAKTKLLIE